MISGESVLHSRLKAETLNFQAVGGHACARCRGIYIHFLQPGACLTVLVKSLTAVSRMVQRDELKRTLISAQERLRAEEAARAAAEREAAQVLKYTCFAIEW